MAMRAIWIGTSGWHYPSWRGRVADFLKMLPRRRQYAFEFRHPSWYDEPILDLLREHDIALCISDHHDAPSPRVATARHVYIRGHGPGGRYKGHYPQAALRDWARHIARWHRERRTIYCYFDNDQKSAAPKDALVLREMVEGKRA
jgi:uncharacterized protein YecE (DUF72 family)